MAFGLGLYAMIAGHGMASTAESWVSRDWLLMGGEPAKLFDAFILSGFVEELAKWVVLVAAVYHWDEFDEPLDGVVYGVAVALGFATLENMLFVTAARAGRRVAARGVRRPGARAVRRDDGLLRGARQVRSRRQAVARSRALSVRADRLSRALRLCPSSWYGGARLDRDLVAVRGVMGVRSAPRPSRAARVTFSFRRWRVSGYDSRMRIFVAFLVAGLTGSRLREEVRQPARRRRRRAPNSTRNGRRWPTRRSRSSTSRTIAARG